MATILPLGELCPHTGHGHTMTVHRFHTGCFETWHRIRPNHLTPVRITPAAPRFLGSAATAMHSCELLMGRGVSWPPISPAHFEQAYRASLTRVGVARIGRDLATIMRRTGQPLILLDWEPRADSPYSRRRIFAAWWLEHTGEDIREFAFHTTAIDMTDFEPPADPVQLELAIA